MRPLIGITTAVRDDKFSIRPNYSKWLNKCGGVPVMIPVDRDFDPQDYSYLDGLLLAGGADIEPFHYGEEPERELGVVVQARDIGELALLDLFKSKPVFGICRGMQMMNVHAGGTLYQDIYSSDGSPAHLAHRPHFTHEEDFVIHTVNILSGSVLENLFGLNQLKVPSVHHQAVKDLGKGLVVSATSKDGLVEAINGEDINRFYLGVQWHPEKRALTDKESERLFTVFINNCKRG